MELIEILKRFQLFRGVDSQILEECISKLDIRILSYKRGDSVFSPECFTTDVGIVLSGECEISQFGKDGAGVEMKKLFPGDGFGILAVLLDEPDFPTLIRAKRSTDIAFICKSDFLNLVENATISKNLICFLAERVNFLNKKIATISSGAVEDKLASYLLTLYDKHGDTINGFNKQNVAKILGAGRASLYRALASLSDKGAISIDKNCLKIINIDVLKG